MIKKTISLSILFLFILISQDIVAQGSKKSKTDKGSDAKVDTKASDAKKEPKTYKKVIDSTAVTQKGLIDVHKMDNKYLFEIPNSLLGSEMMTITRYSKTPAGGGILE